MWLVGVVVMRYIDILIIIITFPTPLLLALFWQQHPYVFVRFFTCFCLIREIEQFKSINRMMGVHDMFS